MDEEADLLFEDDRRFRMVIVGGSALILLETIARATHDIDALDVSPEIVDLLEKYDINTRVGTFINNFPYNYDERLVQVRLNGRRIDFYTASLEDIVIAKLYSGRATDMQDIIDPKVTDLRLNPGNLNAWLKHGNSDKVSLETARRTLRYVEAYGVQPRVQ